MICIVLDTPNDTCKLTKYQSIICDWLKTSLTTIVGSSTSIKYASQCDLFYYSQYRKVTVCCSILNNVQHGKCWAHHRSIIFLIASHFYNSSKTDPFTVKNSFKPVIRLNPILSRLHGESEFIVKPIRKKKSGRIANGMFVEDSLNCGANFFAILSVSLTTIHNFSFSRNQI